MIEEVDTQNGLAVQLIRLNDGTLIDPKTREPVNAGLQSKKSSTRTTEHEESQDDDDLNDEDSVVVQPLARRSIVDLTLGPQQMAVINNVLVYTLWGLPDDEIAIQCNCTTHQVRVVRDLDEYSRMYNALVDGLKASFASTVDGIFTTAAPAAARTLVRRTKDKSKDIQMAAIGSILDRAGHRPVDRVEHRHTMEGSLTVRVIKQDKADLPTLELSPNA